MHEGGRAVIGKCGRSLHCSVHLLLEAPGSIPGAAQTAPLPAHPSPPLLLSHLRKAELITSNGKALLGKCAAKGLARQLEARKPEWCGEERKQHPPACKRREGPELEVEGKWRWVAWGKV